MSAVSSANMSSTVTKSTEMKNKEVSKITKKDCAELVAENQARALVYNLLSTLFAKEVTEDFVTQLTSTQGQQLLHVLAFEPTLAPSIKVLSAKLAELNSKEALLTLAADFCGLFLVAGKSSVSPYAGQYITNVDNTGSSTKAPSNTQANNNNNNKSEQKQTFGELHQLMMAFLQHSEMQIHRDFPEPADHIAVMLAYLAHLSTSASTEVQLSFINNYLMTWLSDFTEQVKCYDPGGFYRAVAELTFEWIKLEVSD